MGTDLFSEKGTDNVPALETRVGEALLRRRWDLALAESCTGGLVGFRVTSTAGSSRYFLGGVVAYDNAVKVGLLGVKASTLADKGAVSPETALEMAEGARGLLGAAVGLSVTGVAGPGGGTAEKPVGLVCAAVSREGESSFVERRLKGDRDGVRRQAADMALELLLSFLESDE